MGCEPTPDSIGSLVMPCGPSCGIMPPAARSVLVTRIPQEQLILGRPQQTIQFDSCAPRRDSMGRHAYVTKIVFKGSVNLITGDVTNAAVPGYQVCGKIGSIFLRDCSGNLYLAGDVNGRDLIDDVWFRNYRLGTLGEGSPGLEADTGVAGDNTVPFELHFPLTPQGAHRPSMRGAIPLAALADADPTGLEWTPQALPLDTGGVAYEDVSDGGFNSDLEIWADIVYLKDPMVPAAWQVERYVKSVASGRYNHADRIHEYLAMRPMPAESDSIAIGSISGVTISLGNELIVKSLTTAQMLWRNQLLLDGDLYGRYDTDVPGPDVAGVMRAEGLPLSDTDLGYLILIPRSRGVESMGAGAATYSYAASTGSTAFPYLHRTIACQNQGRINAVLGSMLNGCSEPMKLPGAAINDAGQPVSLKANPAATLVALSR